MRPADALLCLQAIGRRIKNLLLQPGAEWPAIAAEPARQQPLLIYIALLAAIPATTGAIEATSTGIPVSAGSMREPLALTLVRAAISYAFSFAIVYLTALAIELLAPLFGGRRGFMQALKLAAYSYTPVWLIGIVLVVPELRFLSLLGLYALRLLWTGAPILKDIPPRRALFFALVVVTAGFAATITMAMIQGLLLRRLFSE